MSGSKLLQSWDELFFCDFRGMAIVTQWDVYTSGSHRTLKFRHSAQDNGRWARILFTLYLNSPCSILTGLCEPKGACKTPIPMRIRYSCVLCLHEGRFGLCSKLYQFVQSLFSLQSVCTVRIGFACRVGLFLTGEKLVIDFTININAKRLRFDVFLNHCQVRNKTIMVLNC